MDRDYKVIYVLEKGFAYAGKIGEWIPITENQFNNTKQIIEKIAEVIEKPNDEFEDSTYLLKDHFIRISGKDQFYKEDSTRIIEIKNENSFILKPETKNLVKILKLPEPK